MADRMVKGVLQQEGDTRYGHYEPFKGWQWFDTGDEESTTGSTGTTTTSKSSNDASNPTYSSDPGTQSGSGAYGSVPGKIGIPENTYQGVTSIYPGLTGTTGNVSNLISSQLAGEFTPETESALWDTANKYGVASGMPGAGLWSNKFMGNVAGAKEALQQQGVSNYNNTLSALSKLVTQPETALSVAEYNALMSSAANPTKAAEQLKEDTTEGITGGIALGRSPAMGTNTSNSTGSWLTSPTQGTVDRTYQDRLNAYNQYWSDKSKAGEGNHGNTNLTVSYNPWNDADTVEQLYYDLGLDQTTPASGYDNVYSDYMDEFFNTPTDTSGTMTEDEWNFLNDLGF